MTTQNAKVTINKREYQIEGTITMSEKIRSMNGAVLWVSLIGAKGGHFTLACYENGGARLFQGAFERCLALNPAVA